MKLKQWADTIRMVGTQTHTTFYVCVCFTLIRIEFCLPRRSFDDDVHIDAQTLGGTALSRNQSQNGVWIRNGMANDCQFTFSHPGAVYSRCLRVIPSFRQCFFVHQPKCERMKRKHEKWTDKCAGATLQQSYYVSICFQGSKRVRSIDARTAKFCKLRFRTEHCELSNELLVLGKASMCVLCSRFAMETVQRTRFKPRKEEAPKKPKKHFEWLTPAIYTEIENVLRDGQRLIVRTQLRHCNICSRDKRKVGTTEIRPFFTCDLTWACVYVHHQLVKILRNIETSVRVSGDCAPEISMRTITRLGTEDANGV